MVQLSNKSVVGHLVIAATISSVVTGFSTTRITSSSLHHQQQHGIRNTGGGLVRMVSLVDPSIVSSDDTPSTSTTTTTNKNTDNILDLDGIKLSGLQGKALKLTKDDFPSAKQVKQAIPKDCFNVETKKSMGYLSISVIATSLCTFLGTRALTALPPTNLWTLPFWSIYSAITGTVGMGLWVLAHECGHGAFSKNKKLQDIVGYIIHTVMLVPYYSWQRSHAVHHVYTNHMEYGETHVPETGMASINIRKKFMNIFGKKMGLNMWGGLQLTAHLLIGWPAYLLIGATGGPARGITNHFLPDPMINTDPPTKKELFPGPWKKKVLRSDLGIAAMVTALCAWTYKAGIAKVMALYGGPLLVINAWLVTYTWLQHTDVDVPHFSNKDHTYVMGALHTIDRPYDKLDPFGLIDFLHHRIGSTHVAHHFDCSIPHYKAKAATIAIKKKFPKIYLYDPTPIHKALWRVAKGCTAVENVDGVKYVWNNKGLGNAL